MKGSEIRQMFLQFFEARGHRVVPSSSLVPDDPGLLLTNAGMNQFAPYFLGRAEPEYRRATTVQKVFRAVDIENVGHTDRHFTFFEMLGNFSFGDYFKAEACRFAFELITEGYGIDPARLWASVYEKDDETLEIWPQVGIPPERLVLRGKVDEHGEPANFWWMHTAGPCGPCSEIFVDRGPAHGPDGGPDAGEERFCEVWNLVFMQDECDDEGNEIAELPHKNIDTGSSLERVAMVLQDAPNAFETDLLRPLVAAAERATGRRYGEDPATDVALRILADHGRGATFLIADGVRPSNEGRGYVLRRVLRRLVTYARRLGVEGEVTPGLIEATVESFGRAYPELAANREFALQVAASEEERFGATYRQGIALLEEEIGRAKAAGAQVLPGAAAFRLHDTYGFQEQLTEELAGQEGLSVDVDEFARLMDEQRRRAQAAAKHGGPREGALDRVAAESGPSEFLGYEALAADGTVRGLVRDGATVPDAEAGQTVRLVLDRTPFYAEGGGQVGDRGLIRAGQGLLRVTDTAAGPAGTIVHDAIVESGGVRLDEEVRAEVDPAWRAGSARSHTGTHVLHSAVRQALGEHARQAGSLVAPGRVRFDFTHFEAVSQAALEEIEAAVNDHLAQDGSVRAYETTFDFARSLGAIALFGEKYGEIVRVVEVGDYSVELCGGTHVRQTGEVAFLRLLSASSIGSGFRRIEALVGRDALDHVNLERRLLEEVTEAVGGGSREEAPERVRRAVARVKQLESELGAIGKDRRRREAADLAAGAREVRPGVRVVERALEGLAVDDLREIAQAVGAALSQGPAVVVLGARGKAGANLVVACTKAAVAAGVTAPEVLRPGAELIGGRGGGKPGLAIGGGPRLDALAGALAACATRVAELFDAGASPGA